ncbi:MAG: MerR family transcriptional regulator [Rubrobacteraceae bacterium]
MDKEGLTVKEVAALTGLSDHTLRYYEREGLVDRIGRAGSGHRRYSERDVAWIEFLGRLRATGMPIRKMKRFADLRRRGESTVPARRALLEEHRTEVRRRISELERDLRVIDEKIGLYEQMEARSDAATRSGTEPRGANPLRTGVG